MKTVAIVGSEPKSKGLAPYQDESVDIWLFNQGAKVAPRVTAAFQVHNPAIYKDPTNKFDLEHWDWLKQNHDFPIYMVEIDSDVPSSVQYPLTEILAKYPEVEKRMFTQSGCYALALALYLGYEKVEIYGIENAHYSEYSSEREGFIYWVGFLQGKGVIVDRHSGDNMFDNPLYGRERLWEQDPKHYGAKLVEHESDIRKYTRLLTKTANGEFDKWNEALYKLGVASGRKEVRQQFYDRVKEMIRVSGKAVFTPGELKIDKQNIMGAMLEGRGRMEQARGANDLTLYAEAALKTAHMAGRMMEIDDMMKEAEEWQSRMDIALLTS